MRTSVILAEQLLAERIDNLLELVFALFRTLATKDLRTDCLHVLFELICIEPSHESKDSFIYNVIADRQVNICDLVTNFGLS